MLLVWLQGGVTAAAPTASQTSFATVVRRAGLTAAVLATLQPVLVERFVPAVGTPRELAIDLPWQNPRVLSARRSVKLLGDVAWAAQTPAVQVVYQEGWRSQFSIPPQRLQLSAAVNDTASGVAWTPQDQAVVAAAVYGFTSQSVSYWAARRSPAMLGQITWPPQPPVQAVVTYQEGWRQAFSQPLARRAAALRLQGFTAYAAEPPNTEYQDGWRSAFSSPRVNAQLSTAAKDSCWQPNLPPQPPVVGITTEWVGVRWLKPPRAAVFPYGINIDPFALPIPAAATPTNLWWPQWQDPAQFTKAKARLEGFVAWPGIGYATAVVVAPPTDWWRTQWTDAPAYTVPRRSVGLLGQAAWDPPQQAAPTQYNFEVHNERHLYSPAKRSPLLLGQVAWPGIGYSTAVVVAPPSDWWRTQWQDPAKARAPRLEGFVAWPGFGYSFVVVAPTEGWRAAFAQPLKLFQPPRQQGFVSFAGTAGLPVTFSPGPWAVQPAAYWVQRRNWRLAASWPWQAYSFTIPAATPSAFWMPPWQERPKERLRSVYLRQGSWAGWDPQFVIQITPPTPLEGITFTFGLKRGASATPGVKEGATMTGQRKTGGATLITRVKPRNS